LEVAKFRDYWIAQPGQRGVKLDWNATFRNWVRSARPQRGTAKPLTAHQQERQTARSIIDDLEAEIVILSDWKQEREEYQQRRTERHKRKLLRDAKEGLPAFPGGIDDMELGDK
jgi:hypothetical protein